MTGWVTSSFSPCFMASCTGPNAMHVPYDFLSTTKIHVGSCEAEDNFMILLSMPSKEEILVAMWKYFPYFLFVCDSDYDLCMNTGK